MSETIWREVSLTAEVEMPAVPNFLRVKGAVANDQTIPLSAVREDDLRAIGAEWTDALVRRSKEQRTAPIEAPSTTDTGEEG